MDVLEGDPGVVKWTKRHGIEIPWRDTTSKNRVYRPDYLVELADGSKELREVKGNHLIDQPETQMKFAAARDWCRQRGMLFKVIYKY